MIKKFNEFGNINENRETTEQEKKVFLYLNDLRDSGATNMFGASSYIQDEFGIDRRESSKLLSLWMSNFNEDGDYDTIDD